MSYVVSRAVVPDPHSFSFLDPDSRSGSRRKKLKNNNKKCKEIDNNCSYIKFFREILILTSYRYIDFLLLNNLFLLLIFKQSFLIQKTLRHFLSSFLKLDPGMH